MNVKKLLLQKSTLFILQRWQNQELRLSYANESRKKQKSTQLLRSSDTNGVQFRSSNIDRVQYFYNTLYPLLISNYVTEAGWLLLAILVNIFYACVAILYLFYANMVNKVLIIIIIIIII